MKIGLIFYHSNVFSYIDHEHIFECLRSIDEQTFKDFDIFELNYSKKTEENIFLTDIGFFEDKKITTYRKECRNHIEAMNFLLNKTFNELDYDVIFNVNLDDIYNEKRVELQLMKVLEGYHLISSNYTIFQEKDDEKIRRDMKITKSYDDIDDEQLYIKIKISKNKNIIPTSAMCFTKKSWEVLEKIPYLPGAESLLICKKALSNKLKIHICPEILVDYRIHDNQASAKYRNNIV